MADRQLRDPADPYAASNRRITVFLPYSVPAPDAAPASAAVPDATTPAG